MVHKIHRGEDLPSVQAGTPYQIIGQQPVGPRLLGRRLPAGHPQLHDLPRGAGHAGRRTGSRIPCRAACGPATTTSTSRPARTIRAASQADDSQCASCHRPQGDREWDASIMGAHTVPSKSTQLKGLNAEIVSVTNAAPGQNPTVIFKLTENDGTPSSDRSRRSGSSNLNLLMGGPTADYAIQPVPRARRRRDFDGTVASTRSPRRSPPTRRAPGRSRSKRAATVTLIPRPPDADDRHAKAAFNPVAYAAVTAARRSRAAWSSTSPTATAATTSSRSTAASASTPQECVICHNPNGDDSRAGRRTAPAESIDFKRMIHRIHTRRGLTQDARRTVFTISAARA